MQLWLFAHSVIRQAETGTALDSEIGTVARALRHASQENPRWLKFLRSLIAPLPLGFGAINHHLSRRARYLSATYRDARSERNCLVALAKIANFEFSPSSSEGEADGFAAPIIVSRLAAPLTPPEFLSWQLDGDVDAAVDVIEVPEDVETLGASTLVGVPVTPEENLTQQLIAARSVLLLGREQAQFLPWSWEQLSAAEERSIRQWLEGAAQAVLDEPVRLLAAAVWLAIATHRSLEQACDLPVNGTPGADWTLCARGARLHRQAPRPKRGWRPQPHQMALLAERASVHLIELPAWLTETLASHLLQGMAPLRMAWRPEWPSINALFRKAATRHGFGRVQPHMLGRWLPSTLFRQSSDPLLAISATARPMSGLPGATAYPAWPVGELTAHYSAAGFELRGNAPDQANALGSELSPLDAALEQALTSTIANLKRQQQSASLATRHNGYTAQIVVMLLAATGARPIVDPFESIAHFDLVEHRVFIADKVVQASRRGRLLPLAQAATTHLREHYLPYLTALTETLRGPRPSLSAQLDSITTPQPQMPLFFFLPEDLSDWQSASESTLQATLEAPFPLPLNCFRHRLSQGLRRRGVDAELIDALLGHAYAGSVTHGDQSLRMWKDDMEDVRAAIEGLFAALSLPVPQPPQTTLGALLPALPCDVRPFGLESRAQAQRERHHAARQQARALVESVLGGRELHELTTDELEGLERALLFTPAGLPHPLAGIRYRFYLRITERHDHRHRITKRRRVFVPLQEEPPFHSELAVRAQAVRDALDKRLQLFQRSIPPAKARAADAELLCCLHLMLECRVAHPELLLGLRNPACTRLVFHRRRYWLEYRSVPGPAEGDPEADAPSGWSETEPVVRLPISRTGAAYLIRAQQTRQREPRSRLAGEIGQTLDITDAPLDNPALIAALASVIDQANAIELPGVLAGYLGGRVTSFSLGWHDLIALDSDKILDGSHAEPTELLPAPGDGDNVQSERPASHADANVRARAFFRDLRNALVAQETGRRTNTRRDLVRNLHRVRQLHEDQVSTAIAITAHWICELAQTVNRLSSVRRYLSALSGAAEDVWYDTDLIGADEEDLTEHYQRLLDARPTRDLGYVGELLRRFHAFARRAYGIADPLWDELPIPARADLVAPGYIREADYLLALRALSRTTLEPQDGIAARAILVLCYRFGLRAGEAFGLCRCDWVEDGEHTSVLVQNHAHRKVKRPASRRIVPLLFPLCADERAALEAMIDAYEASAGSGLAAPLHGHAWSDPSRRRQVHAHIISALRNGCANPRVTLHHARHTFAARVFIALVPGLASILPDRSPASIPTTLLGHDRPTRRSLWALARLLGHAHPATTFTSYVHLLDRWAAQASAPATQRRIRSPQLPCTNLDALPKRKRTTGTSAPPEPRVPSCLDALHLLRLVARGRAAPLAAGHLGLQTGPCEALVRALNRIAGASADDIRPSSAIRLLRTLTEGQWDGLLNCAVQAMQQPIEGDAEDHPTGVGEIAPLIGRKRQILMAKPEHFQWVRSFLTRFSIPPDRYVVTATDPHHTQLQQHAREAGFDLVERTGRYSSGELQIDVLTLDDGFSRVPQRAALLFHENSYFTIRNRIALA
ncbi:site-specific integrase [Thauera aromatica]|nr:site-specific integrase [Thauera aromatica]MCK2128183.1 site-specific integrase [Thauera aromatica]